MLALIGRGQQSSLHQRVLIVAMLGRSKRLVAGHEKQLFVDL